MTKISDLKKRLMNDPEFQKEYEEADAEFALVEALLRARTKAKMSQADVAKRIGTTQSAIARLKVVKFLHPFLHCVGTQRPQGRNCKFI
ncbi:helix-turn-helix domain-containing protein [Ochrobactrum sp. BTU1]|uniref:helix-turn-helix domain-containing protein n=1 Tax=Ochrobactrum sp. BTU1 TaxID=2840456 RepID=UPI00207B96E5